MDFAGQPRFLGAQAMTMLCSHCKYDVRSSGAKPLLDLQISVCIYMPAQNSKYGKPKPTRILDVAGH
ncbi:hypothetical protein GQ44DRAFT_714231 [Phaeosphaeriaceae sp. PMI808]|nr:hypothetical protein GQ44DRAFT_714231 [Phaeosphaeriaceae sp. PMI808]